MKELKKQELSRIFFEFKEDNKKSYDILYKEYYSIVYGIVFPILKNKESAEDIVQEIFIKIYNMDKVKFPEKGELSWLYTVSRNEAINYLRKKKQEIRIEEIYEVSDDSNEIEKLIDIHTYNKIISGLNEQEQQIVSLKIISNFTFKKIGQMLSMPTPTVQWKYYKAVDSLKISIGNFVGFIFMFLLLMVRKEKVQNNSKNIEIKYKENSENTNSQKEEQSSTHTKSETDSSKEDITNKFNSVDKSSKENSGFLNIMNNSTESTMQDVSNLQEKVDVMQPILISLCGVFLIISIIFAIFFKNYQQKRNKKLSK